jgi:integrase
MARVRLRYVIGFRNKKRANQRIRFYFRRRGGKAIPLPGMVGSEEFMAAYGAALAATSNTPTDIGAGRTAPGTVDALVVNYYKSAAWLDLAEDSRRTRRYIIERFRADHGGKRVALMRRDHFEKMLAEMRASSGVKANCIKAIRALMKSGIPSMLKADPTEGIVVRRPKTPGHKPWTAAQIEQYRAYWPLGTQARLVLEFAYETVSRRGEVVQLGPQHLYRGENGEPRIKIARIKGSRDVDIQVTPELLAACNAMPRDHLTYIHTESGKPLAKGTLGFRFAQWATEAGLPKHCRMHGLKKTGMSEFVRAGATAPELMNVSGHRDMAVAQKYIEEVFEGPELADEAFDKLQARRMRSKQGIPPRPRTKQDAVCSNTQSQLLKRGRKAP